jgi:hypothetical protein
MVIGNVPAAVGVPESVPPELRVTPAGRLPAVTAKVGAGKPVAVTVKVPGVLNVKVVLLALVITGGVGAGDGVTFTAADAALEPVALVATTEQL